MSPTYKHIEKLLKEAGVKRGSFLFFKRDDSAFERITWKWAKSGSFFLEDILGKPLLLIKEPEINIKHWIPIINFVALYESVAISIDYNLGNRWSTLPNEEFLNRLFKSAFDCSYIRHYE